jgi:DNA-directed RNA polymerase subunit RPC12/RpoP
VSKRFIKCPYCHEEILHDNPKVCPYCGNPVLIPWEESSESEMEEIENLEKAGRFEDAAQKYEELEMWEKAGECRRRQEPIM